MPSLSVTYVSSLSVTDVSGSYPSLIVIKLGFRFLPLQFVYVTQDFLTPLMSFQFGISSMNIQKIKKIISNDILYKRISTFSNQIIHNIIFQCDCRNKHRCLASIILVVYVSAVLQKNVDVFELSSNYSRINRCIAIVQRDKIYIASMQDCGFQESKIRFVNSSGHEARVVVRLKIWIGTILQQEKKHVIVIREQRPIKRNRSILSDHIDIDICFNKLFHSIVIISNDRLYQTTLRLTSINMLK